MPRLFSINFTTRCKFFEIMLQNGELSLWVNGQLEKDYDLSLTSTSSTNQYRRKLCESSIQFTILNWSFSSSNIHDGHYFPRALNSKELEYLTNRHDDDNNVQNFMKIDDKSSSETYYLQNLMITILAVSIPCNSSLFLFAKAYIRLIGIRTKGIVRPHSVHTTTTPVFIHHTYRTYRTCQLNIPPLRIQMEALPTGQFLIVFSPYMMTTIRKEQTFVILSGIVFP